MDRAWLRELSDDRLRELSQKADTRLGQAVDRLYVFDKAFRTVLDDALAFDDEIEARGL